MFRGRSLARVSANPRAFAEYLPPQVADSTGQRAAGDGARPHVGHARAGPGSAGEVQLYNSVLSLLA